MARLNTVILTLVFLSLSIEQAQSKTLAAPEKAYENFKTDVESIPRALQQQGLKKFGALQLQDFLQDLLSAVPAEAGVKFVTKLDHSEYKSSDLMFTRSYAEWSVDDSGGNHLTLNTTVWIQPADAGVKKVIALHEALGILGEHRGFNDHQYQISMAMWTMLKMQSRGVLTESNRQQLQIIGMQLAGGIYGSGGGGDGGDIEYKIILVRYYIEQMAKASDEAERANSFQNILQTIQLHIEVSQHSGDGLGEEVREIPDAIDRDLGLVMSCRTLSQKNMFEGVWERLPETERILFPTADDLRSECRRRLVGESDL